MQYGARKQLEETIDADFVGSNAAKVIEDHDSELPSEFLALLVVERIEGHLCHKYAVWCATNDEEMSDQFVAEITDMVVQHYGDIESIIDDFLSKDDTSGGKDRSSDTDVFST